MSLELVCVNYGSWQDAQKVMSHSCKQLHFREVSIIHPSSPFDNPGWFKAKSATQNECWVKELPSFLRCDHILSVQWDGFIINPSKWNPEFLKYDWIGCPWRLENIPNPDWRVGSGGFCMFSRRMAELWPKICNSHENHDWQVGALYRKTFENLGMKYAPFELACQFGKECDLEDTDIKEGETFGFHGFQYGNGYREKYRKIVYG